MRDSNWTLKFPRSEKEAFGYETEWREPDTDSFYGWVLGFMFVFFIGVAIGRWL